MHGMSSSCHVSQICCLIYVKFWMTDLKFKFTTTGSSGWSLLLKTKKEGTPQFLSLFILHMQLANKAFQMHGRNGISNYSKDFEDLSPGSKDMIQVYIITVWGWNRYSQVIVNQNRIYNDLHLLKLFNNNMGASRGSRPWGVGGGGGLGVWGWGWGWHQTKYRYLLQRDSQPQQNRHMRIKPSLCITRIISPIIVITQYWYITSCFQRNHSKYYHIFEGLWCLCYTESGIFACI